MPGWIGAPGTDERLALPLIADEITSDATPGGRNKPVLVGQLIQNPVSRGLWMVDDAARIPLRPNSARVQ